MPTLPEQRAIFRSCYPVQQMLGLLPEHLLVKTGCVDHADWNYRPILGPISRLRFQLLTRMLANRRFGRLLEIGYGSGIFMPELGRHCEELYGLDIHYEHAEVARRLADDGTHARLLSGSATSMPFGNGYFDCIVAVSALEFIEPIEALCREVLRVLAPNGSFLVVTPGHSPILDFGFELLTGKRPSTDFEGRREQILPALRRNFHVAKETSVTPLMRVYTGLDLQHPSASNS